MIHLEPVLYAARVFAPGASYYQHDAFEASLGIFIMGPLACAFMAHGRLRPADWSEMAVKLESMGVSVLAAMRRGGLRLYAVGGGRIRPM